MAMDTKMLLMDKQPWVYRSSDQLQRNVFDVVQLIVVGHTVVQQEFVRQVAEKEKINWIEVNRWKEERRICSFISFGFHRTDRTTSRSKIKARLKRFEKSYARVVWFDQFSPAHSYGQSKRNQSTNERMKELKAYVQYQLQVGTGSSGIFFKRSFFCLLCDAAADRIDHFLD